MFVVITQLVLPLPTAILKYGVGLPGSPESEQFVRAVPDTGTVPTTVPMVFTGVVNEKAACDTTGVPVANVDHVMGIVAAAPVPHPVQPVFVAVIVNVAEPLADSVLPAETMQ